MPPAEKRSDESEPPLSEKKQKRPSSSILGISRSITACQRCRLKKLRCDHKFPKCSRCVRANVECVGLDSATGRQVPRSYIVHLEDRIAMLESKLVNSGIDPDSLSEVKVKDEFVKPVILLDIPISQDEPKSTMMAKVSSATTDSSSKAPPSYIGGSSLGISFARLMLTAVKFKQTQERTGSAFQPIIDSSNLKTPLKNALPALLPPKHQAERFLECYFAQSNSQLPILHRERFIKRYFEPIYGSLSKNVSLASNYSSINRDVLTDNIPEEYCWFTQYKKMIEMGNEKDIELMTPLENHKALFFMNIIFAIASSIHHLEYPVQISEGFRIQALKYVELVYSSQDRLESLQGLLLLTAYSIMRPSVPGVWYTLGSVLRVCVDLGLHTEQHCDNKDQEVKDPFLIDMRRRLFWCAYSLDRQVCFYLGRPFGIPEECIDALFPSELDDALIVENVGDSDIDFRQKTSNLPSYKSVSIAMFKIRKLQLEVQKILYGNGELPRAYKNLAEWKLDMNKRLNNWKISAPKTQKRMNCDFNLIFFNLNFNHTRLILHGLSPKNLTLNVVDYLTVADSSMEVIRCYKTLLELKRINYTWVAVHNLFMAGTSYLYSIYHCPEVASQTSLEQIKMYSAHCVTVLNSLIDRCDAALHCRDTFEILSAAVVRLKYEAIFGDKKLKPPVVEESPVLELPKEIDEPQELSPSIDDFQDLKIPSMKVKSEEPNYQQQYHNSLLDTKNNTQFINEEWVSNSYDLDKFFQELEAMGSFSPTNSSTHSEMNHAPDMSRARENNSMESEEFNLSKTVSPANVKTPVNASNAGFNIPKKLPSTREGQRIYNMIMQVPDEPIWEQFFNTQPPN